MSYPTYADETPQSAPQSRPRRRGLAVGAAIAAAGAAVSLSLWAGSATAEDVPTATTYTPTASQTGGFQDPVNINNCSDLGLVNLVVGDTSDADDGNGNSVEVQGDTIFVTIAPGYVVDAIVVKGASAANIYYGPFVGPALVGPLVAPVNASETNAGLSHFLVCGGQTETETSGTESTDPGTTTIYTPTPGSSTTPGLPKTGAALTGYLIAGVALIAGGVATLLLLRRRRDAVTPSV